MSILDAEASFGPVLCHFAPSNIRKAVVFCLLVSLEDTFAIWWCLTSLSLIYGVPKMAARDNVFFGLELKSYNFTISHSQISESRIAKNI